MRRPLNTRRDEAIRGSGVSTAAAATSDAATHSDMELTILMPCLNEAETIETCVRKANEYLRRSGVVGEVLLADNGSTDGSQALAAALGARVIPISQRGYGAALLGGIAAARGRYIIMGDADDSYDLSNLDDFVAHLRAGSELVMGNRFKGGIETGAMPTLHRYLGNPVLSFIGRWLFGTPTGDFHCGLRGFNTESIRQLGLVTTGMEFASEMVVRSSLSNLAISEVPTTLKPDGRSRAPHLKTWSDGWRHLKFLLIYNPRWLFLIPGAVISAVSLALVVMLATGPVALGENMVLDINSFTAACFMLIAGVQIVGFGLLARQYATISGMLPPGQRAAWFERNVQTNLVVRVAVLLLITGSLIFGLAIREWAMVGFGDLTNPAVNRSVIAGLTLVVISLQLGFGAFMIDLLRVPFVRRPGAGSP
jgi:hypothetical protein